MSKHPKGRCPTCGKNLRLDLKGTEWVIPSHEFSVPGINPECTGTGKLPK